MKSMRSPLRHSPRLSAMSHANPPTRTPPPRTPHPRNRQQAAPRPPRRPPTSSCRRLAARAHVHTGPRQGAVHTWPRQRTVHRASRRASWRAVRRASWRAPPVPRARFRHSSRWSRLRPTRRCRTPPPPRTSHRRVRRRRRRRWPASERLPSDFRLSRRRRRTSERLPRDFRETSERLPRDFRETSERRRRTRRWRPAGTLNVRRRS